MALQQVIAFDSLPQTNSITFNNPSQVDQVVYSGGNITFQTCSSYNLSKSDLILYCQYLNAFNNNLFLNFPSLASYVNTAFPTSSFQLSTTFAGVKHINYVQTSGSNTVLSINYVPIAMSGSVAARSSPVNITYQEFFMMLYMISQYSNQVSVN
jgi:hypothetical protein